MNKQEIKEWIEKRNKENDGRIKHKEVNQEYKNHLKDLNIGVIK